MSITRSKSINTIYEECKDFDLVLVPDAPLASAINRRLDRPQFGPFAISPRRLAAKRREQAEDRLAFLKLVNETELNWKEAANAVGNILQCWEYSGSIDAILEYDAYATHATRAAVEHIAEMDTTSRQLTEYSVDDDVSTAVVGIEQFTELERSIFPTEYTTIDPFTDEPFDHPQFHLLDSPAAIIDTLLDTITEATAEDIAIVLDQASEYSSLVESALEAEGIPYYGGPGFTDDPHHRAFLHLLRSAHAGRDTQVRDIKPLLTQLGLSIDVEHNEKCLHRLDIEQLDWFHDFRESISTYSFESALDLYESTTDSTLERFRDELQSLGIADEIVSEEAIDRLEFYLQSYEVPIDRENEGVLLADAKSAAHVDRPVVFYLGLDEDWTHSSPRRPWVDTDQEFERNIRQFQLLLQSGVDQYYLVQDSAGGAPVTPCLYFEELLDEEFERFSDLDSIAHTRPTRPTQDGFEKEPVDAPSNEIETISQSSLKTYVNSPRDYFYSRLVQTPDKERFKEGNLFHDFAEFYVNHPTKLHQTHSTRSRSSSLRRWYPIFGVSTTTFDARSTGSDCR
nr:PD-(D/E)XK nuclease family protein [Haladaptatus sp. W1]